MLFLAIASQYHSTSAYPQPSDALQPGQRCDPSWNSTSPSQLLHLLDAAPTLTNEVDLPELQCRKDAIKAVRPDIEAWTHCPTYFEWESRVPHTVDCNAASFQLPDRLKGWEATGSFGIKDEKGDSCDGQTYCLPIEETHGNCKVTLDFETDWAVDPAERHEDSGTDQILDARGWLEYWCTSWSYVLSSQFDGRRLTLV